VTALFGPTGSGKSTILNIIAGLTRPQQGRVDLGDLCFIDCDRGMELPPQRRRVGYVPQEDLLFPHLSVENNLRFGMRYASERSAEFSHVVRVLGLTELLGRSPSTLSGGQRQRVALGRAVLRGPQVLLMDEPINAQDEGAKHRLIHDLCAIVAELNLLAIFVSHDQTDVRRFAERVVLLDAGRVVGSGSARTTLDAVFKTRAEGVAAPTNLVRVVNVHDEGGAWLGMLGGNHVMLPATTRPYAETVNVSFHPTDVLLAREDLAGVSVRNHWRGRVIDLVTARDRVFVHVDVGQPLWAEVTPDAKRSLGLQPGQTIFCFVKATSLRPLEMD